MSRKKSGQVCAARSCNIKGSNSKNRFYRFPSDPDRAKIWAIKANREDLLAKLPDLNKSYRLCENHFEEKMFSSLLHTRLNRSALPTLFPVSRNAKDEHSYSAPPLFSPKIRVLDDRILECQESHEKQIKLEHHKCIDRVSMDSDESTSKNVYCRLCLTQVPSPDEYFPLWLDETAPVKMQSMKMMVQALIPDLDLTLSVNPIICSNCQTQATKAYSFILNCQKNNNILKAYREQNPDEHFVDIEKATKTGGLKRSSSTKSTPIPSKKPCTSAEEKHPKETVEEPIRLSEIKFEVKDFEDDLVIEENTLLDIKTEVTERDIAEIMLEDVEDSNSRCVFLPEMDEPTSECDVTKTELCGSKLRLLLLDPRELSKFKSKTDENFSDSCQTLDVKIEINET